MSRTTSFSGWALFALSAFLLAGCGLGDTAAPSQPEPDPGISSAVVLTSPPKTYSVGYYGVWQFEAVHDSAEIRFDGPAGRVSLTVPGAGVLLAVRWVVDSAPFFVVGVLDASEVFTLYRYTDSTGDGVPDASTETTVFSSGTVPLYGTSIARTPSGNAFLLDRRCQDIRYVTDTDSDGWPDSLLPVPFAMSGSYPSLLSVRWVGSIGEDIFKASLTDPYLSGGAARGRTFDTYEDQDGDHVCDVHTAPGAPALAFGTIGMPYDGQTILPIRVLHGNGETVQVWGLDPAGATLLGSGTVSGHEVAVAVATPLSEGGKVGIKLLADTAYRLEAPVIPAWPQITDVSPACVTENVAATIEIEGVNFDPNDTVRYHTIDGVAHAAQFTYISATRLDVSIPALAGAQAGPVGITIYGSDQDPAVDTIPAVFQLQFVCAPE